MNGQRTDPLVEALPSWYGKRGDGVRVMDVTTDLCPFCGLSINLLL